MPPSAVLSFLLPGIKYVATGGVIALGQAVATKSGIADTAAGAVLDLLGVPHPSSPPALPPPPVGDANPKIRAICACQQDEIEVSGAETVQFRQCEKCRAAEVENAERVTMVYAGWEDAWKAEHGPEIGAGCGDRPNAGMKKYYNAWGNFQSGTFYSDLAKWQGCMQYKAGEEKKKADEKAAKKALEDAKKADKKAKDAADAAKAKAIKTQKKLAQWALTAQKTKYEKQLKALADEKAAAATAAEKEAIEKKIAELETQKADAEKLADTLATQAKDAAMQAQIDKMSAELAAKAQQPGGMDELMMQLLMQRLAPPAPLPQAPAPAQVMIDPTTGQHVLVDPSSLPWDQGQPQPAQMMVVEETDVYDDGVGLYGVEEDEDDDEDLDPEIADALDLSGVETNREARAIFGARNAGWSAEEVANLKALFTKRDDGGLGGCAVGSCGLPPAEE